jgi:ATP-dependent RNA helicase RhlE
MELIDPLKKALAELQYKRPTPIQAQTIPAAVDERDILGCAQTGTGKTAAFALPILDYLGYEKPKVRPNRPLALVMAPTRELAIQIGDSFREYGKHIRFSQALVYGGVGQGKQVSALRGGASVLIATPGRLQDLMDQGHVHLSEVKIFVLDEADRMLDMGFLPALKKIIAKLPKERQSMFFSATMPPKIRDLSSQLLYDPVSVNVTPKSTSVKAIKQTVRMVEKTNKLTALCEVLSSDDLDRAIVFSRTKHGANKLCKKLDRVGIAALAIHGNKSQNARQQALEAFRSKKVSVLVATDVAARGIDIDGVTHVVNFDMPVEPESYVHRVGRTGRAGANGIAISFCTADERGELRAIEKLIRQKLEVEQIDPDFKEPAPVPKSATAGNGSPDNRRRSRRPRKKSKARAKSTSAASSPRKSTTGNGQAATASKAPVKKKKSKYRRAV